jgi:RNA polymerase sigma factor (TIGR02999 family)
VVAADESGAGTASSLADAAVVQSLSVKDPDEDTTLLLRAWHKGDRSQQDQLFEKLYVELHKIARRIARGKNRNDTLSPTGLVAEAYIRMQHSASLEINDRHHFMALAARTMRRIVIDRARALLATRAGGGAEREELTSQLMSLERSPEDLVQLNEALERLNAVDPRLVMVAEFLVFASLRLNEIAHILGVSRRTVSRDVTRIGEELGKFGYGSGI